MSIWRRWLSDRDHLIEVVIAATLFYNFVLSLVNANIMLLSKSHVMLADGLCVIAAFALLLGAKERVAKYWLLVLFSLLAIHLYVAYFNNSISPKYLRDILLIPIFIALGSVYQGKLTRLVLVLSVTVAAIGLFEAVLPSLYMDVVDVKRYYIATRGIAEEQFYNSESSLFSSATRPGDRFIPLGNVHRVSSVFLEPVSTGNFVVFMGMFGMACSGLMSRAQNLSLLGCILVLLVLSDGRFALVCSLGILLFVAVAPHFLSKLAMLFLPLLLLLLVALDHYVGFGYGDSFAGRLGETAMMIQNMSIKEWLVGDLSNVHYVDSGVLYYIASQSVFSLIFLWMTLFSPTTKLYSRAFSIYRLGLATYLSSILLISYSSFTIKTAAILFFVFGYLYRRNVELQASSRTEAIFTITNRGYVYGV